MPIPKPKKNEKKADFISRCISTLTDKNEFNSQDQRAAICYSQWDESINEDINPQGSFIDEQDVDKILDDLEKFDLEFDREEVDFVLNAEEDTEEYIIAGVINLEDIDEEIIDKLNQYTNETNVHIELYNAHDGEILFSNRTGNEYIETEEDEYNLEDSKIMLRIGDYI